MARWWWLFLLRGIAGMLFGLAALVWPGITAVALVLLFATWAIVDGGSSIVAALRDEAKGREARLLALEGIVAVAAGVVTFAWPQPTLVVLALVAGTWLIVGGALELLTARRLRAEIRGELLLVAAGMLSVIVGVLLVVIPVVGIVSLSLVLAAFAVAIGALRIGLGARLWAAATG
jgi:uncharacterized membrane protein HdeD (DUF308 family)